MANQEHLDILKQGVAIWNQWRQKHPNEQPDLRNAYLTGAKLSEADLVEADLRGAELSEADLRGAKLSNTYMTRADLVEADLSRADLSRADLVEADLAEADLTEANLSTANLLRANLNRANLSRANLNRANLGRANLSDADLGRANLSEAMTGRTVFANVDLRETKGLVDIMALGPSYVSLNTVQLPQDGSALHFLRSAGVSDEWIGFWRTTAMHPIQYHSLFISYSSNDETLARRLHADLQNQGVRCWFAPEDMKIGDKIRARIDGAIHRQDKVLLLLSEHAIASTWVEDEVEAAFEKEEKQQREVLFPVRLDESVMQTSQAWAASLRRTRHIGDFTNWTNPQEYQRAFDRLLRDLKQS